MPMARHHLFEFCDLAWLPTSLRSLTPTFLEAAFRITRSYTVAATPLAAALRQTADRQLLDLGSGGAGPVLTVRSLLASREGLEVKATLSDKFPSHAALHSAQQRQPGHIDFIRESVDATQVPADLPGFRTMFQILHHFRPDTARAILQDAVDCQRGIAIFEVTQRTPLGFLQLLLLPFAVLFATPFVRPLPLWRLLLTYVLPLAPLMITWDGFVSTLRSYTPAELTAMTQSLTGPRYHWSQGHAWKGLQKISWLIGYPEPAAVATSLRPTG
ncbi:MAG: hypothetical protein KA244_08185 [Deltaproteobacteria bacterium]|nr:hypothetical protein [Deltaproteobacteria bacterium]